MATKQQQKDESGATTTSSSSDDSQEQRSRGNNTTLKSQNEAINEILEALERSQGSKDPTWKRLLTWLESKDEATAIRTCKMKGNQNNGRTLLHVACCKHAPAIVVKKLLEIAPETITWQDNVEKAEYGVDIDVLIQQRLKLGMGSLPITGGSTPLHLACQYGVTTETARHLVQAAAKAAKGTGKDVITDVFTMRDSVGNTPLHIACTYIYKDHTDPSTMIQLLLEQSVEPKLMRNRLGFYPFRCLASASTMARARAEKEKVMSCFDVYIQSFETSNDGNQILYPQEGDMDPRFFVVLGKQAPPWLIDHLGLQRKVQERINTRFSSLRLTSMLLFRLACFGFVIVGMHFMWLDDAQDAQIMMNSAGSIDPDEVMHAILLSSDNYYANPLVYGLMILGFVGIWLERWIMFSYLTWKGQYFALIQKHPSELMSTIVLVAGVIYAPLHWLGNHLNAEFWLQGVQTITAIVIGLSWCGIVVLLRLISVEFAEITDGAASAGQKIWAFMVALTIILVAFAQMFNILAQGTDTDGCTATNFCDFNESLLTIYTFSAGQVDNSQVPQTTFGLFLYVLFVYIVVILLTNVLAFILGSDILNRKNTEVGFWSMRIYYLATVDAFDQTFHRKMPLCCKHKYGERYDNCLRNWWDVLRSTFRDQGLSVMSCTFWVVLLLRFLAFLEMLIWVLVGLFTFGMIWPPQVREYLMANNSKEDSPIQTVEKTKEEGLDDEEEEQGGVENRNNEELVRLQDKVVKLEETVDQIGDKLDQVLRLLKKMDKNQS